MGGRTCVVRESTLVSFGAFERLFETAEHSATLRIAITKIGVLWVCHIFLRESNRKMMMCLTQFAERSVDSFEVNVDVLVIPTLGEIRGNRIRRASQLRAKLVHLELGKPQGHLMN